MLSRDHGKTSLVARPRSLGTRQGCTYNKSGTNVELVEGAAINIAQVGVKVRIGGLSISKIPSWPVLSLVPNPTPSFSQYGKAGRTWYISSHDKDVIDKCQNFQNEDATFCMLFNAR